MESSNKVEKLEFKQMDKGSWTTWQNVTKETRLYKLSHTNHKERP